MKKILLFLVFALLLAAPAYAAQDPASCEHDFQVTEPQRANCTEKGLLEYTCVKCGLRYTMQTLPNGEHDYEQDVKAAACTEDGLAVYTCRRCGETYSETLPATGHTPGGEAGCTEGQVCVLCGETLVPPTGHSYAYQYDATFDDNGGFLTFGTWLCANCGKSLNATEDNAVYYYSLSDAPALAPLAADEPFALTEEEPTDAPEEEPVPEESFANPRNTLWIAVAAVIALLLVVETVVLVRTLRKSRSVR